MCRLGLPCSRLAVDVAGGEGSLREAREHKDALARANAELYAEMQRLAAESALGPLMVLDADGNVRGMRRTPCSCICVCVRAVRLPLPQLAVQHPSDE